jgi:uncharacterized protein YndB with AHSA1/START domain
MPFARVTDRREAARCCLPLALASLLGCHPYGVPRVESRSTAHMIVETTIAAPPQAVWDVLVEFERYDEWNAWLPELRGEAIVGERAVAKVWLDGRLRRAAHRVLEVDAPVRLCWRDAGITTWFVWAMRCRTLEPIAGGTLLREELVLDGNFVGAAMRRHGPDMQAGMAAEAHSLREHVER